MKNFHILGVHLKIRLIGGLTKNQYIGGNCLKGRGWTVCQFKGEGWQERGGAVFEGKGLIPDAHYMIIA